VLGLRPLWQLGNGATSSLLSPVQVRSATDWASGSAGYYDTCGIRTSGELYCWGYNWNGEVGDGTNTQRSAPTPWE
jgi:alpha-tubulin suppressor-like RCC1 family protein